MLDAVERQRYSPEQRAQALEVYATNGLAEAVRRTGVAKGTISAWANRSGAQTVYTPEKVAAAAGMRRASVQERKAHLAELLLEVAELSLTIQIDLLNAGDANLHEVVGAGTRAIHDMQLLMGEATARTETITDRTPVNEEELAEVVGMFTEAA